MRKKFKFEIQLVWLMLIAAVPPLISLVVVMSLSNISTPITILTCLLSGIVIAYCAYLIQLKTVFRFRSLTNLLEAMINGEYSLRARSDQKGSALDELTLTINSLAEKMNTQRWASVESQYLVRIIIEHIDVAIVAFGENGQLRFANPAAHSLLNIQQKQLHDMLDFQTAFAKGLKSGEQEVVDLSFDGKQGRFKLHVEEFREGGQQHKLLFITDVRQLLRHEEAKAWQSLVRVISHEINNSLSPIASISQTLSGIAKDKNLIIEHSNELHDGLSIISERAQRLGQFVDSYNQLAKLPAPQKKIVSLVELINQCLKLYADQNIIITSANDVQINIDPVQIEQVFINLIKNSIEAMTPINPSGKIEISWQQYPDEIKIFIQDEGIGIGNLNNLFVPFYTTKKHGSGIGLLISRQIIEAHNGQLILSNRTDARGCETCIILP